MLSYEYTRILFSLLFGNLVIGTRTTQIQNDNKMIESSSKQTNATKETVKVEFYYESLCPYSIDKYRNQLQPIVANMKQYEYLHVITNPYGHAKTIENNGTITFKCQHGSRECYGNMLQACAIKYMPHDYKYIDFNACLLSRKSNDNAADSCGELFKLDPEAVKKCAKGPEGTQLLKAYGELSAVVNFKYVPYVLVNGVESRKKILDDICDAFQNPPDECKKIN